MIPNVCHITLSTVLLANSRQVRWMSYGYAITTPQLQQWLEKRTDTPEDLCKSNHFSTLYHVTNAYLENHRLAGNVIPLPNGCRRTMTDSDTTTESKKYEWLLLCWAFRMPKDTDKRPSDFFDMREPRLVQVARFWRAGMSTEWQKEANRYATRDPGDGFYVVEGYDLMNEADSKEAYKILMARHYC